MGVLVHKYLVSLDSVAPPPFHQCPLFLLLGMSGTGAHSWDEAGFVLQTSPVEPDITWQQHFCFQKLDMPTRKDAFG